MHAHDPAGVARAIIDANLYMVLGTADRDGRPWVSPVYYAPAGYAEFYWVSYPEARHSRNLAVRPRIGIVIFDSRAPIGTGQGVYMSAVARELAPLVASFDQLWYGTGAVTEKEYRRLLELAMQVREGAA